MLAAFVYLAAEAVTAAAFPGYSYANNYISDLGIPDVGAFDGRTIDSPLHAVMNSAFVVSGLLYLAAAVLAARLPAARQFASGYRRLFVGLAAAYAVGIALVGLVPGSQTSAENGLAVLHVAGAALAIVGGNLAAITAGIGARKHARFAYCLSSIILGAIGLFGLVMLQVNSSTASINLLPDGAWERIAVYTVTAWQLLTGILLLRRAKRDQRPT